MNAQWQIALALLKDAEERGIKRDKADQASCEVIGGGGLCVAQFPKAKRPCDLVVFPWLVHI